MSWSEIQAPWGHPRQAPWGPHPLLPAILHPLCSLLAPGQEGSAGTSLGSRGLRLHASNTRGLGWIPGWETKTLHASQCRRRKRGLNKLEGLWGIKADSKEHPVGSPVPSSATCTPRAAECLLSTCFARALRQELAGSVALSRTGKPCHCPSGDDAPQKS